MKPDTGDVARIEQPEPGHLRHPADATHTVHRYAAPDELSGLVRRFWIPVWSVPPGEASVQQVLQHPVALVIVTPAYARFYGVTSGLSSTTLEGDGFGVGVLFEPAAGSLLTGGSMAEWTDRHADLVDVLGEPGQRLAEEVVARMQDDPSAEAAHRAAIAAVTDALRAFLPVDDEGRLVNEVVRFVEERTEVTRVAQVCEQFGLSERTLQRLTQRRLGLNPKWVIQRRRLHEAADRLRAGRGNLAAVAAELGYADQAHLTRDVRSVTGLTPGELAAWYAAPDASGAGRTTPPTGESERPLTQGDRSRDAGRAAPSAGQEESG
ncbi:MAG: helix-turn-helix domain-containing protein [Actinomycetota bacterium]